MKIIDCIQGTGDWWEARKGVPTASNFDRIVTSKGLPSKGMTKYIAELISDRACLCPPYFTEQGRPITKAMSNGTSCEPEARRYLEMELGLDIRQVGFCLTDDGRFGCSPDGLIGDDGGVELKCPELKTHAEYLMKGEVPRQYKAQVHGSMIVTERPYWMFMSYAPGLDPLIIRVTPDEFTDKLRAALEIFWERYQEACAKLLPQDAEMAF